MKEVRKEGTLKSGRDGRKEARKGKNWPKKDGRKENYRTEGKEAMKEGRKEGTLKDGRERRKGENWPRFASHPSGCHTLEGRKEGRKRGRKEGRNRGRKEGRNRGRKEGRSE